MNIRKGRVQRDKGKKKKERKGKKGTYLTSLNKNK